jgi:hypothetical protein
MSWESYHREIIKAKEEYDQAIKPIIAILEQTHKETWDKYILRISQAECLLKEA